ncbi:MAG: tRNA preQ1(34) S-adenosylmethionine ribosyltransferase-isomerase QueA [Nostocaceae cyanobacterium]|nr:tRNA preQ1(34) S-adenosylmethionine ribosyltransferase-isomerase QueA [Nostocaceae cyanobacterium]
MKKELPDKIFNTSQIVNPQEQEIDLDHSLDEYDYELPEGRIAQNPAVPRDSSRLLVVDSPNTGQGIPPLHHIFRDLPEILNSGDLLVMNNTKVMPARMYGQKSSGAMVEVLLLEERQQNIWLALVKPGKRFKIGSQIFFTPPQGTQKEALLNATVVDSDAATGGRLLQFDLPEGTSLVQMLELFGEIPLPPYITKSQADSEQYQTVYASQAGAVAAPTAGLHFTPELLQRLEEKGIHRAFLTLHVGVGTFRPVEVKDVTTHQMHEEWIEVSADTVEQIRKTKEAGGRIIAVGTTVVRSLEGAAAVSGKLQPFCGKTNLFIYPGFQWRVVDGLITNFHLPRSSLMMLVSALISRKRLLNLYQEAINQNYRFYSFGDAMLILPEGR